MTLYLKVFMVFSPIIVMLFTIVLCMVLAKYKKVFTSGKNVEDNYIGAIIYGTAIGGSISHILLIILVCLWYY